MNKHSIFRLCCFVLVALACGTAAAATTDSPAAPVALSGAVASRADAPQGNVGCPGGCDDSDHCTVDTCDGDTCQHEPFECNNGNVCDGLETCDPFIGCVPGIQFDCDDGNPCDGAEYCENFVGCVEGLPPDCSDGTACTVNNCEPPKGCFWTTLDCNDSNDCTEDSCDSGTGCVNSSIDGDGDGVCIDDNCPDISNGDQSNQDGDGYGDACDPCINDQANDFDGDGWCESSDNCPDHANSDQANEDGDSYGDVCDPCSGDPVNDWDGDGYCAIVNNCPITYNPEQLDQDGDFLGDDCDSCPGDPANDYDNDGYCGDDDNCPGVYNTGQSDSDKDGVGDACAPARFDFLPEESTVAEGYYWDYGYAFDASTGWGWSKPVATRDRTQELPQQLNTFAFSRDEVHWTVQIPNGDYDVQAVCGDPSFAQGPHRVSANGSSIVNDETTPAGQFVDRTSRVSVRNGRLDVTLGGTQGNTTLGWLGLTRRDDGPQYLRSIVFQDESYDAPEGFEPDYGYQFDGSTDYGWDSSYQGFSQESNVPQVLDGFVRVYNYGAWEIAVPAPGWYEVWFSVGDASSRSGPHRVTIEGVPVVLDEETAAGQFIERHAGALVVDGFLTVELGHYDDECLAGGCDTARIQSPTGFSPNTSINYIVLSSTGDDSDDDGVDNGEDLCPFVADEDQEDSDGDSVGDACDSDVDGDGYENTHDVCAGEDDDQTDSDGDGIGDACDVCEFDPFDDHDGDGVCGLSDVCPEVYDPSQDDTDGDGLGDACGVLRVNFGPADAVPEGFVPDDGSTFDWFLGRGWSSNLASRDRRTAQTLELDTFVFSSNQTTWQAEVPNGEYHVRASIGDPLYAQGPEWVMVQGQMMLNGLTLAKNEFEEGQIDVSVRTGRLEVAIGMPAFLAPNASMLPDDTPAPARKLMPDFSPAHDDGGIDRPLEAVVAYTTLNWVEATPLGPPPGGIFHSVNFQPADADRPNGFTVDSGQPFDEKLEFGWLGPVQTRHRGLQVPQVLDTFAFTAVARTWEGALPPGFYRVHLSVGDPQYQQGPQRVLVEGESLVNDEITAAGEFIERDTYVMVLDGRLTITIGGAEGNTCLNYLTVEVITDSVNKK